MIDAARSGSGLTLALETSMLRRSLVALALASLSLGTVVAPAAHAEELSVSPASAPAHDTFTFTGSGFQPGAALLETYTAPNGEQYWYFVRGDETLVAVGPDGGFAVEVNMARDIPGHLAGRWQAHYCYDVTSCWHVAFDVEP